MKYSFESLYVTGGMLATGMRRDYNDLLDITDVIDAPGLIAAGSLCSVDVDGLPRIAQRTIVNME